jgi:hypothetical protein
VSLIAIIGALLLATGCNQDRATAPSAEDIASLGSILPILASEKLETFRNLDWCRVLRYGPGAFAESESPSTCVTFDSTETRQFDSAAAQDFDRFAGAFEEAGVPLTYVGAEFDGSGHLTHAAFEIACQGCASGVYFFTAPGLPNSVPEGYFVQVTPEWRWAPDD